jgi:hypothetical protein
MDSVAGLMTDGVSLKVRPFEDSSACFDDTLTLRARADESGYLFFRGLIEASLVRRLRRDILTLLADRHWVEPAMPLMQGIVAPDSRYNRQPEALTALQVQIQLLPLFRALRVHSSISGVLERLFGAPPRPGFGDVCRIVTPAMLNRTTPPHQDHFYTRGHSSQWTVWMPIGPCPVALGGLLVWPGSHREGLYPHDRPIEDGHAVVVGPDVVWRGASFRCGDVLMFNALTVHQARPNLTADRLRLSVDFRYVSERLLG